MIDAKRNGQRARPNDVTFFVSSRRVLASAFKGLIE
jgi:hypothetical protein